MRAGFAVVAVAVALLASAGCGGGASAPSGPFEVTLALTSQSPDGMSFTLQGSSDRAMSCVWDVDEPDDARSKTLDGCAVEIDTFGDTGRYDVTVTATDDAKETSVAQCRFSFPNPSVNCMTNTP